MTLPFRERRNGADSERGEADDTKSKDRNPIWFTAYRTRRFLQTWAIVFLSLGVVFTVFWANAYDEISAVCDPHKPLGIMAWGPMAAAALVAYGTSVVLFGLARLSDLGLAQHEGLTQEASPPDEEA